MEQEEFRGRREEIDELVQKLDELQKNWGENTTQINSLLVQIDRLREHKKNFWQQISRNKWMHVEDANSAFFHQSTCRKYGKTKSLR